MNMTKRIFCLALVLVMLTSLTACGGSAHTAPQRETSYDLSVSFDRAEEKDELTKISDNGRFTLYANLHDGTAAVKDEQTGQTWYTNPEDRRSDGLASGFNKNALLSPITVAYTTDQSVDMTCGAFMSSVGKDGLYYHLQSDGSIIFLFNFPNEGFTIPVRYAIEEDRFTATVLAEGITEYGTNKIKSIDLLPFFGAGSSQEDGFMLVPDGSGALIYYNNNRLTANTYNKAVYGFDNGTSDMVFGSKAATAYFTVSENQYLPVFGSSRDTGAFLAVITQGSARANIKANVAYKYTLYNTVWSSYNYRTVGTVRQTQKDGSETAVTITEKKLETWMDYQVSYFFLPKEKNSLGDMAAQYRSYLVETEGLVSRIGQQEDIPLYLDLYGYIEKTKSFLGIPRDTKISMTTLEDANSILDALQSNGVENVAVKYNYWAKNSFFEKLPVNMDVDSKVGTKQELLALQQRLEDQGGKLYLSADLLNVYKTGRGVSKYRDVLLNVANVAQRQYKFALDTAMTDSRYDAWYLLRPWSIPVFFEKLTENAKNAGVHALALDSVGTKLYSELSSDGMGRNQALRNLQTTLDGVDAAMDGVLVEGANVYAATEASALIRTPFRSSGYDLEDVSVPFYQMVFHGYASYTLEATNLASDPATRTLNCIEFGASPLFSLVGRNQDELIGSRLDALYSADASDWLDFAAEQYSQINAALRSVQNSTMTDYQVLSNPVRVVTYDNGTRIYVNYGEATTVNGIRLEAKGFAVVENGRLTLSEAAVGEQ